MAAKTLMVQGTASSVGKSTLVTALCRIFRQDGLKVAPFKAQNMALNSYVTEDGGEIGRAQAVQAEAAGIEPTVDMNPVLLKPEADERSQIVVRGKVAQNLRAETYYQYTAYLWQIVQDSLKHLLANYEMVVIEGAGSPAEVNLKKREIVNMRVARQFGVPVVLVGDIDRGGVFASLIGTLTLLTPRERSLVQGLVINKFRGDLKLLQPGLEFLEKRTGKPVLGVIPYFRGITIAQEDSVYLEERRQKPSSPTDLKIAVIRLPHISNYDDFDPLEAAGGTIHYVATPAELDNSDLIILPGTKSTVADLAFLRQQGLDRAILSQAQTGTPIIGICGGYQMLGQTISDPHQIESKERLVSGLGLLDVDTVFHPEKRTIRVKARVVSNWGLLSGLKDTEITGYEIHLGQTTGQGGSPAFQVRETPGSPAEYFDGVINPPGRVLGSYLHGLFHNTSFTRTLLRNLRQLRGLSPRVDSLPRNREEEYDRLAQIVRENLDLPQIYRIIFGGDHG